MAKSSDGEEKPVVVVLNGACARDAAQGCDCNTCCDRCDLLHVTCDSWPRSNRGCNSSSPRLTSFPLCCLLVPPPRCSFVTCDHQSNGILTEKLTHETTPPQLPNHTLHRCSLGNGWIGLALRGTSSTGT